ncbi:putative Ig domain-containing protein, partial [Laspinema palackyanum]|uniref:putative Ig domain-containing protein n=1 Tax=Laspinema palackyanum TaxID=3231601 RepID=UPI00345DA9B1|nr:putative Ig domain-containing protein [Laspinema sp. D2c]
PLPDWLSFDPETGALSGTPDEQDVENLEIRLTADDGQGNQVPNTFALVVDEDIAENRAPEVTIPIPDQNATAGEAFSFAIPEETFTDPEGDPLTVTATLADGSPLPDWLSFDPETGALSGTPDEQDVENLEIRLTADDGQGNQVPNTFALVVDEGIDENIRPEVNLNPEAPGVDTTVTFDPEAEGVPIAEKSRVTDPDPENNTLTSATIEIANLIDGDAEELIVDTEGTNITATVENGVVTLTGDDDVENYERVLQRIRYNNTAENPDLTPRNIEIVVSDGINQSPVAIATVEFPPPAALEITKTVSDPEATIGEELSYTVTLTNQGGTPATGITVTESLPNWLTDVTFTPTEGNTYDPTADVWTIPRLEGGETTTLTISGILSRWGTIPNRAQITAVDQGQPNAEVAFAEAISPLPGPDISLSNMTLGYGGLVIYGENPGDLSGRNVSSAGDINSDGFNDILIGTRFGDRPDGTKSAGRAYVLFGGPDIGPQIDLRDLNGSNGFAIYGVDKDDAIGRAVSNAGDINGDGFDDIMVASRFADGPNNDRENAGESYIIFGGNQFDAPIDLATLDGTNGFTIFGREEGDQSGRDVHAGDINGDGVDDLLIGAFSADGPNNTRPDAGETYVIFGGADTFNAEMDLANLELDGTNGFTVFGAQAGERSGRSPRSAGDINGDGYNDLLIGAPQSDDDGGDEVGATYLVYGGPTFNATVDLADINGTNGVRISGINAGDLSGRALSNAGDINGDGLDDMIIGAQGANDEAGESYVIFGSTNLPPTLDLGTLNGTNGFTISGINAGDLSGRSVSNAGDINGDGYDDLIINASLAPGLEGEQEAGQSYVLFGGTTFNASLDLEQIDGTNGFTLYGIEANNRTGRSVSAGDVNGDGFDDVLVGAPEGDGPNGTRDNAGETYIMYGGDFTGAVTQHGGIGNDSLTGTAAADVIIGAQGDDTLIGGGGADVIYGGSGNHLITVADSDFRRLEGGSGEDSLRLDGDNFAFDLTTIADNRIHDIETIDLNGANNSLNLDQIHVLHLSDRRNRVIVTGEETNAVTASGNWVAGAAQAIGNDTYNVYTSGKAQLWVEEAIAQDGISVIG